jgi:hypothetical protein
MEENMTTEEELFDALADALIAELPQVGEFTCAQYCTEMKDRGVYMEKCTARRKLDRLIYEGKCKYRIGKVNGGNAYLYKMVSP